MRRILKRLAVAAGSLAALVLAGGAHIKWWPRTNLTNALGARWPGVSVYPSGATSRRGPRLEQGARSRVHLARHRAQG